MILYYEWLYTCKEIISEFVVFIYLTDEIVTLKKLWEGLNSRSDIVVYFDERYIDELHFLKDCLHILIMILGAYVLGYI